MNEDKLSINEETERKRERERDREKHIERKKTILCVPKTKPGWIS